MKPEEALQKAEFIHDQGVVDVAKALMHAYADGMTAQRNQQYTVDQAALYRQSISSVRGGPAELRVYYRQEEGGVCQIIGIIEAQTPAPGDLNSRDFIDQLRDDWEERGDDTAMREARKGA